MSYGVLSTPNEPIRLERVAHLWIHAHPDGLEDAEQEIPTLKTELTFEFSLGENEIYELELPIYMWRERNLFGEDDLMFDIDFDSEFARAGFQCENCGWEEAAQDEANAIAEDVYAACGAVGSVNTFIRNTVAKLLHEQKAEIFEALDSLESEEAA